MPFKPKEREYRSMPLMAPVGAGDSPIFDTDFYVEGYATTYDQPYTLAEFDGVKYREVVERGALDGADLSDVIMQFDHEGRVLARHSGKDSDTLYLRPDNAERNQPGFFVAADLSLSSAAKEIYSDIQSGLVTGMSWAFSVADGGEWFDYTNHIRHITRIRKVYDVSAVSIPANDNTGITARNCERMAAELSQELTRKADERNRVAAECAALEP